MEVERTGAGRGRRRRGKEVHDAVGEVVDEVGAVCAGVQACILGEGGGGLVGLEAAVRGGARLLAGRVHPDARGGVGGVNELTGWGEEEVGVWRAIGAGEGGREGRRDEVGKGEVRGGEPGEMGRGVAAGRRGEAGDGGDHFEVAVVGEDGHQGGDMGGHAGDDVVGYHREAGVGQGVDEVMEAPGVFGGVGGCEGAAGGVEGGVGEEGGDGGGVGAEGDRACDEDSEAAQEEDKLATAGFGGVKVEAGLGRLAVSAGLAVLGGDPAVLADVTEEGGSVEREAGEGGLAGDSPEGGVAGEVGGAVVVLEDAAAVKGAPGTGAECSR